MNWEAIKFIYDSVLVYKGKIEYLGGDKFKLIFPHVETEYKNKQIHGKYISWHENGQKMQEAEYQNGELHGKNIGWHENGNKHWETEYKDGRLHGKCIHWNKHGRKYYETEHQNEKQVK